MKSSFAILLATVFALTVSASAQTDPLVTLRVSGLPMPNATEPIQVAELKVQAEFQRRYPGITLVAAEGIRLENTVSEVTTLMMIAGGIAPDVLRMNFRSIDTFVRKGMVAPLEPFLAAEEVAVRSEIEARIPPQVLPVVDRNGPDGQRHFYALPTRFMFTGLYFNRELFQRAGLPARPPKDWAELVDFSRRLKQLDSRINPVFLPGGASASWTLLNFLWSSGAEAVVETQPDEWRAVFDTPDAVTAYEFYFQLVEGERLVQRGGQISSPQEQERTGMLFGYVGDSIAFDPEQFGFGPVPAGPGGLRGSEINANVLGIFSGVTDPAVRLAAWQYIRFLASADAERLRVETLVEMGLAAQVNPVLLRRFGFTQYLSLMPPGVEDAFLQALESGKPEPYGRNCNLVYSEMTYPLDKILLDPVIAQAWREGRMEDVRRQMGEILTTAVKRTNERMLGYVPEETMRFRRWVTGGVVVAMFGIFVWVGVHVSRVFSAASRGVSQPVSGRGYLPWLFLAPALLLVFSWKYIPLFRGTLMAFQDYQLVLPSTFVGLDNFANVLFDPTFWNSLLATLHYAMWVLTLGFAAPVLLAYALHLIPKHKLAFRILYYLPAVISATAVFFLWRELFGADGPLNTMFRWVGFEMRRSWTEEPALAMLSCILPGIWAGMGPGCLIYLAALKTIPTEQFEAAELDGATFLHKTKLIVFPNLKALLIINFTGAVAAAFHGATNILLMTGGGPNGATEVTSLLIFFEAFTRLRLGHATAMAWILGSLLIGITVLQLQRLSKMEFKTAK